MKNKYRIFCNFRIKLKFTDDIVLTQLALFNDLWLYPEPKNEKQKEKNDQIVKQALVSYLWKTQHLLPDSYDIEYMSWQEYNQYIKHWTEETFDFEEAAEKVESLFHSINK